MRVVSSRSRCKLLCSAAYPLHQRAGAMNTGKAYGDMNGVTLTFQAKEPEPAYKIYLTV